MRRFFIGTMAALAFSAGGAGIVACNSASDTGNSRHTDPDAAHYGDAAAGDSGLVVIPPYLPCENCVLDACPAEFDACSNNLGCGPILTCVDICFNQADAGPDTAAFDLKGCVTTCFKEWDGGTVLVDLAKGCLAGPCKAACAQ